MILPIPQSFSEENLLQSWKNQIQNECLNKNQRIVILILSKTSVTIPSMLSKETFYIVKRPNWKSQVWPATNHLKFSCMRNDEAEFLNQVGRKLEIEITAKVH